MRSILKVPRYSYGPRPPGAHARIQLPHNTESTASTPRNSIHSQLTEHLFNSFITQLRSSSRLDYHLLRHTTSSYLLHQSLDRTPTPHLPLFWQYVQGINTGLSLIFPTSYIFQARSNMVLKLYGLHASHFVRLVAAVLMEKQVPFEFVKVDLSKGEQRTPEFLAKNPFGLVPYIVCHLIFFSL